MDSGAHVEEVHVASRREQLEQMLSQEVDRRFELDILDRLRGKRLSPMAQAAEPQVAAEGGGGSTEEEGMNDDDLAMLQALDNASA